MNKKKRIIGNLLIMVMVVSTMFTNVLPSFGASTANVNTITDSVWTDSERNIGIKYDANSDIHDPTHKAGVMSGPSYWSANGTQVYCIDPPVTFHNGTKAIHNAVGFRNISQADLDYLSAGKFYIDSQNLTSIQKTALTQALIWKVLGERNRGYRLSNINLYDNVRLVRDYQGDFWKYEGGTVSTTLNTILANANNYAREHQGEFTGTANVYYNAGEVDQATMSLSYVRKGFLKLKKTTASNSHLTELCPENYTVEGAIYSLYSDRNLNNKVGDLVVGANGESNVLGSLLGKYYLKETKAPKGYSLDDTVYVVNVNAGEITVFEAEDKPVFDPLSLTLYKKAENGADKNLPLEGAEYTVKYYKEQFKSDEAAKAAVPNLVPFRTWVFRTNEEGYLQLKEDFKVGGDELFIDEDNDVVGLIGTYSFEETKAPKGFAKTEGLVSVQRVTHDNSFDHVVAMNDIITIEKTQKAQINIQKVDAETSKAEPQGIGSLAGAVYEVFKYDMYSSEDEKVGEIVTDAEGKGSLTNLALGVYYVIEKSASAGYLVDSQKHEVKARATELNTPLFTYDVTSKEKPITVKIKKISVDENGAFVNVSGAKLQLEKLDGTVVYKWTSGSEPEIIKGVPLGEYNIVETEAPEGYLIADKPVKITVKETEDVQEFDFENESVPNINTVAKFEGKTKNGLPNVHDITDNISYSKLLVGHPYKYIGKLLDSEGNAVIKDGEEVKAEITFTADKSNMENQITFEDVDLKDYAGKNLVVVGELHRTDRAGNTKVAEHNDLDNLDQTLNIPEIHTTAKDKVDDGKLLLASKESHIIDKVSYTNLVIGKKYVVKGYLMNKDTGKPVLVNGNKITAEKTFIAEESNGFVEMEFIFDSSVLAGSKVVVFEDVYENGIKVATHSDIEDEEQSVYIPKIHTTATDKKDGDKSITISKEVTVIDKVSYEKLITGKIYTVKGYLVDKNTGKPILQNGDRITAEKTFIAEEPNGFVEMEFTFDSSVLVGKKIVVFESIYFNEKEIATHNDINDEGQTVKIKEYGKVTFKTNIPHTGDETSVYIYIISAITACGIIACLRLKKNN